MRRMPQRIKTNVLNETYFFYGYISDVVLMRRSDAKTSRMSTCGQLRDYMKIPLRGSAYHGKLWKTESYSDRKSEVVIINGPCRFELGKRISLCVS